MQDDRKRIPERGRSEKKLGERKGENARVNTR